MNEGDLQVVGTETVRIDEITIGARHRRDLGDVAALARSIA